MLGNLARWLRILGFDTAYDPGISDEDLVVRSLEERRHILTRDRALPEEWRIEGCTLLEPEEGDEQLKFVLRRFGLAEGIQLFSRCTVCNSPLGSISREEARNRVPAMVLERQETFAYCSMCDQVYWDGSHTERMRARLKAILDENDPPGKSPMT